MVNDTILRHVTKPEIAQSGMVSLGRMATSAEHLEKLAQAGALKVAVGVLQSHKDDTEVVKNAMLFLDTATLLPSTALPLKELGTISIVKEILSINSEDREMIEIGNKIIKFLEENAPTDDVKEHDDSKVETKTEEEKKAKKKEKPVLTEEEKEAKRKRKAERAKKRAEKEARKKRKRKRKRRKGS